MQRWTVSIRAGAASLPLALALGACAGMHDVEYARAPDYAFAGKTIGLAVVLDPEEQEGLSDTRVARRTISSAGNEGYADDPNIATAREDVGIIHAPLRVDNLAMELEHSRYYDTELIHPMIEWTTEILEGKGFAVKVVPVPAGDVEMGELANRAHEMGCDLVGVETVSLVRSWNVRSSYRGAGSQQLATQFRWQHQMGGLVLANFALLDIAANRVVWEHSRNDIDIAYVGPLLGDLWNNEIAETRYRARPGQYQGELYRKSADRALNLLFASNEPGFQPLPDGSPRADSLAGRRYSAGDRVWVKPADDRLIRHLATVVSDDGEVTVRWDEGTWEEFAERTRFPRARVMPLEDFWPPLVWVRLRDDLRYVPYRFVSVDREGLIHVDLAGDVTTRTFLTGRVAIIPE